MNLRVLYSPVAGSDCGGCIRTSPVTYSSSLTFFLSFFSKLTQKVRRG